MKFAFVDASKSTLDSMPMVLVFSRENKEDAIKLMENNYSFLKEAAFASKDEIAKDEKYHERYLLRGRDGHEYWGQVKEVANG